MLNIQVKLMSKKQLLRLGLFQLTAGGLSVLFLGVLNRVMRVELGMNLFTVSVLIGGGHYLGALVAIPFGFFSDRHPIAGYRRTVYVLLGGLVTSLILIASPFVGLWIAQSPTTGRIALGFGFFLMEGLSTYIAGTAYLALIADANSSERRGRATAYVWTMLMVGIILTGIGTGFVLEEFNFDRLTLLFLSGAGIAVLLSLVALWGQEKRITAVVEPPTGNLKDALQMVVSNPNARRFGAFLFFSMLSYFMQDVILEPFGGDVFGMGPAETTRFNAYMGLGVIPGMLVGGIWLMPRRGKRWTTGLGTWILVLAFIGLATSSFLGVSRGLPLVILLLGLGAGFFTVGGVALMMDMTAGEHTGLFVGAWTLIQALAKGPASLIGGGLHDGFLALGASAGQAYGSVFALEAVGVLVSIVLLSRLAIGEFQREADSVWTLVAEAGD
jgi:MFS transporter, BCD family, chlorophyll transporter